MSFEIGEVLTKAWQITWKHKVLWLFGFLISISQAINYWNIWLRLLTQSDVLPPDFFRQVARLFDSSIFWVIFLAFLGILLAFLILASTSGQIAIIKGVAMADQSDHAFSFAELFNASKAYFWRVFEFSLVVGLAFFLIFVVVFALVAGGIFLVMADRSTYQTVEILGSGTLYFLIPILCLMVLLNAIFSPILAQSSVAIIVDNLGIFAAISKAWRVVLSHIGQIISITVVVYLIGGVVGAVISIPPTLYLYLPVLVILQSIFTVYLQSVWTLTYRRLTAPAPVAPAALFDFESENAIL